MKVDIFIATGIACSKREPSKMFCKLFVFIPMIMVSSMAFAVNPEGNSMSLDRMINGALIDGLCDILSYVSTPSALTNANP